MKLILLIFFLAFFFSFSSNMANASDINERYYKIIYSDIARTAPDLGAEWTEWTAKAILYYSVKWQVSYAVAAYNAGPDAIRKYGGIPPYRETIGHIVAVSRNYNQLCREFEKIQ